MNKKEFEVQQALGTLNTYDIKINFPRREEPVGLDRVVAEIAPTFTRYNDGYYANFQVEMPAPYLKTLLKALTNLISPQNSQPSKEMVWVYIHELTGGKFTHVTNFRIDT